MALRSHQQGDGALPPSQVAAFPTAFRARSAVKAVEEASQLGEKAKCHLTGGKGLWSCAPQRSF